MQNVEIDPVDYHRNISYLRCMDMDRAAQSLSAVAHVSRLRALRLLLRVGDAGMPLGEIADTLGVRQNTMTTHMQQLERAGFVAFTKVGRSVIYRAVPGRLEQIIAAVTTER